MASTGIYEDDYLTEPETDVESQDESLFDEGPSDGYFERRPHPQERFVENSSVSAEAAAKAREAGPEGSNSAVPPSRLSSAASSLTSTWTMPVVDNVTEAPPPTYESISHDSAALPSHQSSNGMYMAIANLRTPADTQPQSMRDDVGQQVDEETGLLSRSKQKHDSHRRRLFCCKPISLCNAVLILAIVILVVIITGTTTEYTSGGSSPPKVPTPPIPDIPDIPSHSSCDLTVSSHTMEFNFADVQNFTFFEMMESSSYVGGGIEGKVHILPATSSQPSDIRLRIFYATSDSWRVLSSDYTTTSDSLHLQLPKLESANEHEASTRPCMGVWVRIELRSSVNLENWEIATGNLDIQIDDGLFNRGGQAALSHIQVTGTSIFSAIRGSVVGQYWSSRRTEVETMSGSIRGSFALHDFLSLKTQSGSIDVQVDPKDEDSKHPSPAEFTGHSSSGSIKVHFPMKGDIPLRNYRTRLETMSGSLHGEYIIGSLFNYHTQSGAANAKLLPIVESSSKTSVLYTDTKSASQTWRILDPYAYPGETFAESHLDHKFISSSGSLNLVYPNEWEGWIEGDTMSGSIDIQGKDVDIVHLLKKKKYWPAYKNIMARKGVGHGKLKFRASSGSVKIQAGDL